jgi:retron-type reverse transcriptase
LSALPGTITPARPDHPANPQTSRQEGQYEITVPSWSDKLAGEVVRLILEAIYEPVFSSRSHGFRKGRGCHTALRQVRDAWTGTVWFIEGDISDCYGSVDHEILMQILGEKIGDQRFLRLIRSMLKAGYLEDWEYHDSLSGCPQGGLCSAEHKPPYAQCRIMRSAVLEGLVVAGSAGERCA